MTMIRFDDAYRTALRLAKTYHAELGAHPVLVRDLRGCLTLVLDGPAGPDKEALRASLHRELGGFSPGLGSVLMGRDELVAPEQIFEAPELLWEEEVPGLRLLERQLSGNDWLRASAVRSPRERAAPRVVFYGVKGGVGRTTALSTLAQEFSSQNRRVLVVDLDLESPGVGPTMLGPRLPRWGVVDWVIEDGVQQANDELLEGMQASSPLSRVGPIFVVPAGGTEGDYLAKLSRAYLGSDGEDPDDFGLRLERMLEQIEELLCPDVVLLDSRAGLHDLAAVALTRLEPQLTCLFASAATQTWHGYRLLLSRIKRHPRMRRIRESLRVVAALVPETARATYKTRVQKLAFDVFLEALYDEQQPGQEDVFNFGFEDPSAPHFPLPVHWSRALLEYDPLAGQEGIAEADVKAALGEFFEGVKEALGMP
jgi:Mrp family chromosome partitioning ATPase